MTELGEFRGPPCSGANKRNFHLIPLALTFLGQCQRIEDPAVASSVADFRYAMMMIAVFMVLVLLSFSGLELTRVSIPAISTQIYL